MDFRETQVLDSTTLKDYMLCPRRYYWRHILNFRPSRSAIALAFGSAVHMGLETLYRWAKDNPRKHYPEELIERVKADAVATYRGEGQEEVVQLEDLRTEGKLLDILDSYLQRYPYETFRVLSVEEPFMMGVTLTGYTDVTFQHSPPDDGRVFSWVGKMDLIVTDRLGLRSIDHKTTRELGTRFIEQWSPNVQLAGYIQTLHIMYPDKPIAGAEVNAIQVAKTKTKPDEIFLRVPTTRRPDELQQHHTSLLAWAERIYYEEQFPQNTGSCLAYGQCPFYHLCHRHPNPVGHSVPVEDGFQLEEWNPIRHLEDGGEGA